MWLLLKCLTFNNAHLKCARTKGCGKQLKHVWCFQFLFEPERRSGHMEVNIMLAHAQHVQSLYEGYQKQTLTGELAQILKPLIQW